MFAVAQLSIKAKAQRERYKNGQRERGGGVGNKKQPSSTQKVNRQGPAIRLMSKFFAMLLQIISVLSQNLLDILSIPQDVFPLVRKIS